jgi:transcriptional regulator with XRE-family HTH domain
MFLQLIKKCGCTVPETAEALKVSTRQIYEWADGRGEPTPKQVKRLARFLGIDEDEILDSLKK